MLKFEYVETTGWEAAVRGMRNPLNSWAKSDSKVDGDTFSVGEKDFELMLKLAKAGNDHGKILRMIAVTFDLTAPLYFWKQFDTYKVGTVRNSCSTMHTIMKNEFTIKDFSTEGLSKHGIHTLFAIVDILNGFRREYQLEEDLSYFYDVIKLLPESYNQRSTVSLNYAVLRNIYHSRKTHKLQEWRDFCNWIETLPMSALITEN